MQGVQELFFLVNERPLEVAGFSGLGAVMITLIQQVCLVTMYSKKTNLEFVTPYKEYMIKPYFIKV